MTSHKLKVELVPEKAWGKNVRAVISDAQWRILRWNFGASLLEPTPGGGAFVGKSVHGNNYLVCHICGAHYNNLHLHEVWRFNDEDLTQTLLGMNAICEDCHDSIHFGRSEAVGLRDKALSHLMKVNRWSKSTAEEHVRQSFIEWTRRRNLTYKLDLSYLTSKNLVDSRHIHMTWLDRPRCVLDKLDAMSWSSTLLTLPYAVILDTETTGLTSGPMANPVAEVIELAIISVKGRTLYNKRFRPKFKVPYSAIQIHGITNESLKNMPTFDSEYEKIQKLLRGKIVVAYNSNFDQAVLNNTCKHYGLPQLENLSWECAMWAYKGYMESTKFIKLPHSKHSALADCKATLKLIQSMADDTANSGGFICI